MKKLNLCELAEQLEVIGQEAMRSIKGGDLNGGYLDEVTIPFYDPLYYFNNIQYYQYYSGGGSGYNGGGGSSGYYSPVQQVSLWDTLSSTIGPNSTLNWHDIGNEFNLAGLAAYYHNSPATAQVFGRLNTLIDVGSILLDTKALGDYYNNNIGNMDAVRFTIRTSSSAAVIIEASSVGGPTGIVVGVAGALVANTMEQTYNGIQYWMTEFSKGCAATSDAISNGWNPFSN